jgi:hypothetical protein
VKKWPEMVIQWPFMGHKFFLTKLQKICKQKKLFYVIAFDLLRF